jgi:hypothetical protein
VESSKHAHGTEDVDIEHPFDLFDIGVNSSHGVTLEVQSVGIFSEMRPPRVQNFVRLIAMERHNSFEKQDSIHRDAICSRTLSGCIPSLQNTVPFDSKRVAL